MSTFFLHRFFSRRQNVGGRGKLIAPFLVGLSLVSLVPLLGVSHHGGRGVMVQGPSDWVVFRSIPMLSVGQVVHAQTAGVSDEDIDSYAQAVINIEQMRTATFDAIADLMAPDPVPPIACNQPDSIRNLPDEIQDSVVEFCQTSITFVEATGLTVPEFNQITAAQAENEDLFDAIQAAMIRVSQTPNPESSAEDGDDNIEATAEES